MHGPQIEDKQLSFHTLNDDDEVGDGAEGVRRRRPLAKALGDRAHDLLPPVGVSILLWRRLQSTAAARSIPSVLTADDSSRGRGEMD